MGQEERYFFLEHKGKERMNNERELERRRECRNKDIWPEVERRGRTEFETKFGELPRGASWREESMDEAATPAQHEFVENLVFGKL